MISIGIDPGLFGAVVAISDEFKLLSFSDCPVVTMTTSKGGKKKKKNEFAVAEMAKILMELKDIRGAKAWLEKASARPEQGLSSTFKTGRGYGIWEGILAALQIPYEVITPASWSKLMLKGTPLGDSKERSLLKAQMLFPELPLKKPNGRVLSMDGRSDGSLIAYYGMLQSKNLKNLPRDKQASTRKPVVFKRKG